MLVLSRKLNESISIGSDIKIRIISVRGGTVRLGIEAPQEVSILRSELVDSRNRGESPRASQILDLRCATPAAAFAGRDCLV